MDRAVRIILALVLVLVGLSHQPPQAVGQLPAAEVAQYVLPDGSLPDLCISSDEGENPHRLAGSVCDACLISSSTLLPMPADRIGRHMGIVLAVFSPVNQHESYRRLFLPNTAPRAPPVPDSV